MGSLYGHQLTIRESNVLESPGVFITLDRMAIVGDGWVRLKPKSILSGFTPKGDVSK